MAIISVKKLLEAGVHFGHRVSRWNPKMAPFIFGKRNLIHIINLRETVKGLVKAYYFLKKLAAQGEEIILVGTKRQAKNVIKQQAERCRMHYVSERWLGGTLTNFTTIRKRLQRLEELELLLKAQENLDKDDENVKPLSKKIVSSLKREKRKIERNLDGIKRMEKLPGAVIIVDSKKELTALKEAARLSIPTVCLIDTDSDPDLVDIPIPGNEDAMRSIEVICSKLADAIIEGRTEWEAKQEAETKQKEKDEESKDRKPAPFSKGKPLSFSKGITDDEESGGRPIRRSDGRGHRDDYSPEGGRRPLKKDGIKGKEEEKKTTEASSEPKEQPLIPNASRLEEQPPNKEQPPKSSEPRSEYRGPRGDRPPGPRSDRPPGPRSDRPPGPSRERPAGPREEQQKPLVEQYGGSQVVEQRPQIPVEQPKVEQPKVEQPKVEQPKVEQPKVEQPKVEQPKVEQPKVEQPKVEQPKVEQPKVEQPKVEQQAKVEQPKVEQPKAQGDQ